MIILKNLNNFGLLDKGYELYLMEFINHSNLVELFGNFTSPLTECHGEDDANSDSGYSIDFKRFITQDECKQKRIYHTDSIENIDLADYKNTTDGHYDMFKCMKSLKYHDFYNIRNNNFIFSNDIEKKEYQHMTERLLTKNKNIMLYLPKIVISPELDCIIDIFSDSLKDMFKFRQDNVNKDLYFTFLIQDKTNCNFIITKYEEKKLKLIDCVNTTCSKYFYTKNDAKE